MGAKVKKFIKYAAVATIALGVSGVADTTAYALTNAEAKQLKRDLRGAIGELMLTTELSIDAIDDLLNGDTDLSRDEERALLKERRMLATEFRRLKTRRQKVNRWGDGQLNYWAAVYLPSTVSPA